MSEPEDELRGFASPPCLAHEIDPAYSGLAEVGLDAIPVPASDADPAEAGRPDSGDPESAPSSPTPPRQK
tara:strand:+ start:776 stop:985 length:210 start_codon:yes stop_codon:yes gene_type:complete